MPHLRAAVTPYGMPASHDALLAFAHRLLCAAVIARADRGGSEALHKAASPAAVRALDRLAAAPEGQRLASFVEKRRDELRAAVAGAGEVEARERAAIWSHAVAEAALDCAHRHRPGAAEPWDGWSLEVRHGRAVFTHPRAVLSAREFALLRALVRNAGITLTREQLLQQAWPDDVGIAANTVDVYVGYLRRKVGADAIGTVRGVGYRLEPETAAALRCEARPGF
jgi:DNA-binding response OmpR family regulator